MEPECEMNGYTEHEACTRCEYNTKELLNLLGHYAGEWIVGKEATDSEEGYKYRACTRCGTVIFEETIPVTAYILDFVNAVHHINECTTDSARYDAIRASIAEYIALSDEERVLASFEYETLVSRISNYNTKANNTNSVAENISRSMHRGTYRTDNAMTAALGAEYVLRRKNESEVGV